MQDLIYMHAENIALNSEDLAEAAAAAQYVALAQREEMDADLFEPNEYDGSYLITDWDDLNLWRHHQVADIQGPREDQA